MTRHISLLALALLLALPQLAFAQRRTTWMADNGNGTYTNPLFYDVS